jgi:hypothetical protein
LAMKPKKLFEKVARRLEVAATSAKSAFAD